MRRITRTVYKLSELKPKVRAKVLERYVEINTRDDWWDSTYEDAARAGIAITEFDIDYRTIKGHLNVDMADSIASILKDHGDTCHTYKVALEYKEHTDVHELASRMLAEHDDDCELCDTNRTVYTNRLLACYLSMLRDEYTYQSSDEAIADTLEANDYEFTKDGEDA